MLLSFCSYPMAFGPERFEAFRPEGFFVVSHRTDCYTSYSVRASYLHWQDRCSMAHGTQLSPRESALLVVDVQEKLMPKIVGADALIRDCAFLIDVAKLLEVEVVGTEQYPRGLGPTVAPLASRLGALPEKVGFSSCAVPHLTEGLRGKGRSKIVLVGIETHVCVLNTALDLLASDFGVYLAVDALSSRYRVDHETALRRLEKAGAILTTVETCAFEWLGGAHHPQFKAVSTLVQSRMKAMS